MVAAVVDVRSMKVCRGDVQRAFTADCAAGTATLDCEGGPVEIRVLRWGEKCALARFSVCGGEFLSRQMVAACAGPGIAETEHPFAFALAVWLHGPDGAPLPMDQPVLASVTAALCRGLGESVGSLALRPAPEIETLWLALGRQPRTAEPGPTLGDLPSGGVHQDATSGDVNRIVVLADDTPVRPATPEATVATSDGPEPCEVSADPAPVAQPIRPERFRVQFATHAMPASASLVAGERAPPSLPAAAAAATTPPPGDAAHSPGLVYPSTSPAVSQRAARHPAPSIKPEFSAPSLVDPAPQTGSPRVVQAGDTPTLPRAVATDRSYARAQSARAQIGQPPAAEVSAALERVIAAVSRRPAPYAAAGADQDADSLAERLAEEAGALGIALAG